MNLQALILDIDGVVVDSPHEAAWGQTLEELVETEWPDAARWYAPAMYTTRIYQQFVSGRSRIKGARALLAALQIPDTDGRRAERLADLKQEMIVALIEGGHFTVYQDALRLIEAARSRGIKLAAASSSKNANTMLARIKPAAVSHGLQVKTLLEVFSVNVCGLEGLPSKPDPALFLLAAERMGVEVSACTVIEDAPAGIKAAMAAKMQAVGIARHGDAELLQRAGAEHVLESLDDFPWE